MSLCDAHPQFLASFQRVQDSVSGLYDLGRSDKRLAFLCVQWANKSLYTMRN